jgi:hypothetical protein
LMSEISFGVDFTISTPRCANTEFKVIFISRS